MTWGTTYHESGFNGLRTSARLSRIAQSECARGLGIPKFNLDDAGRLILRELQRDGAMRNGCSAKACNARRLFVC
jgi:hypothetical protein